MPKTNTAFLIVVVFVLTGITGLSREQRVPKPDFAVQNESKRPSRMIEMGNFEIPSLRVPHSQFGIREVSSIKTARKHKA